jgi:hypothetical protein
LLQTSGILSGVQNHVRGYNFMSQQWDLHSLQQQYLRQYFVKAAASGVKESMHASWTMSEGRPLRALGIQPNVP